MFGQDSFELREKINILQQALDSEKDLRNRLDIENKQLRAQYGELLKENERLRKELGEKEKLR